MIAMKWVFLALPVFAGLATLLTLQASLPVAARPHFRLAQSKAEPAKSSDGAAVESISATSPSSDVDAGPASAILRESREVGAALKRARHTIESLRNEVVQQPLDYAILQSPVATVLDVEEKQTQPEISKPRRKCIDHSVGELVPVVDSLKKEVDDAVAASAHKDLSEEVRNAVSEPVDQWVASMQELSKEFKFLTTLVKKPPYDSKAIESKLFHLQTCVDRMEDNRKILARAVQKEAASEEKRDSGSK